MYVQGPKIVTPILMELKNRDEKNLVIKNLKWTTLLVENRGGEVIEKPFYLRQLLQSHLWKILFKIIRSKKDFLNNYKSFV